MQNNATEHLIITDGTNGNVNLLTSNGNGLSICAGTSSGSYDGIYSTQSNQIYQTIPAQYYPTINNPFTSPSYPPAPTKRDELKSDPKEESPTGHTLSGILRIYGDAIVVEYICSHCHEVLHREVISKIPKGIIEMKCLPRIVDGVK